MGAAFKQVLKGTCEFFTVAAVAAVAGFLVYKQVVSCDNVLWVMAEDSPVEILQVALLLVSSALVAFRASRCRDSLGGYALVAGLFLCMAIRECDAIFDRLLFHGAWFPLALTAAAGSIFLAARNAKSVVPGLAAIVSDRRFGILLAALATVFLYSRIFGMKQIWLHTYESTIGPEAALELSRPIKNIAEEGLELFGYALITLWSAATAFLPEKDCGVVAARQKD